MEQLEQFLDNGPVEVGLNVGSDMITTREDMLYLKGDLGHAMIALNIPPAVSSKCREVVKTIAMLLRSRRFMAAADPRQTIDAAAPEADGDSSTPSANEELVKTAFLMVYASKINWWQMNHHTGPNYNSVSGVMSKAFKAAGLDPNMPADVHAVWRAVHWWDTKVILAQLGVVPKATNHPNVLPGVSDELTTRVRGNPAGTAEWFDAALVLTTLLSSAYSALIPHPVWVERANLELSLMVVREDPARYHMGAMYLTGRERQRMVPITQETQEAVRAAIDSIYKTTTIARSHALKKFPQNADLETQFLSVRRALAEGSRKYATFLEEQAIAGKTTELSDTEKANLRPVHVPGEPPAARSPTRAHAKSPPHRRVPAS